MATPYPSRFLCTSAHLQSSSKMAFRLNSHFLQVPRGSSQHLRESSCTLTLTGASANGASRSRCHISCLINMAAQHFGDPKKINLDHLMDKARNLWDSSPQPVKSFPWNRALENFIQLILDLVLSVLKYISVPLLAVSSLSEMSYCAHERKLFLIPFPLLIGLAVAGVLNQAALEVSPILKDAEVPWHLITVVVLFTLLKLPGPYYPYWGRIFIPHFANGALLSTLWSAVLWYRRPKRSITARNQ